MYNFPNSLRGLCLLVMADPGRPDKLSTYIGPSLHVAEVTNPKYLHGLLSRMPAHPDSHESSNQKITVRRLHEGEWSRFRAIRLRALEADPNAFGSTLARELAYDDELWIERAKKYASSANDGVWVAISADMFVGTVGIFFDDPIFHMWGVWVEPSYRGKHIASKLVDTAIAWVKARKMQGDILLGVNPIQTTAVELYRSRGFAPTGVVEELSHSPGLKIIEMRLRLGHGQQNLQSG